MNRWQALFWIGLTVFLCLSMWFSASTVQSQLEETWHVGNAWSGWLASAVQIGFVAGSLVSSFLMLADRVQPRTLFSLSAVLGGLFNAAILFAPGVGVGLALRFLTGFTLAGIYPVGVKMLSRWFPTGRGLSMGILIASFTLGSGLPHLVAALSLNVDWQIVILVTSLCALIAGVLVQVVLPSPPGAGKEAGGLSLNGLRAVLGNRQVMYTNFGYWGHMWELYAMWTWLTAYLLHSLPLQGKTGSIAQWDAFVAIGLAGATGCVLGGILSERVGKDTVAAAAMVISGTCALFVGLTYHRAALLSLIAMMIWGAAVIADSAQFSALVADYAGTASVGTALSFQMAVGFLISLGSINLLPVIARNIGWQWIFAILAVGPYVGAYCMRSLHRTLVVGQEEVV